MKHIAAIDDAGNLLFFDVPTLSRVKGQELNFKKDDNEVKEKFTTVLNPCPNTWFLYSSLFDPNEDSNQYKSNIYMIKGDPLKNKLEDLKIRLFDKSFSTYHIKDPYSFLRVQYVSEV